MTKETTYEFIKRIENTIDFITLMQKGWIPLSILTKKVYYEFYKRERLTQSPVQSVRKTTDEYNVSEITIYRAIKFMEE